MQIATFMLSSLEETLLTIAKMTVKDNVHSAITLAKLSLARHGSEAAKERLKGIARCDADATKERIARELPTIVIATSHTGHSSVEGANGPGVVAEDPHIANECSPY